MAADPYTTFLHNTRLEVWQDCLERTVQRVHDRAEEGVDPEALEQALCIAIYVQWLGRVSGNGDAQTDATRRFDALRDVLDGSERSCRVGWGLVLAWTGYTARAATLLERDGQIAPEHLALVVRGDDAGAVSQLRDVVAGTQPSGFLPAVMLYASALVNVGQVHVARSFLRTFDESEEMVVEVLAGACERLGEWADAHAAYARSSWPVHRHRQAMVAAILDPGSRVAEELPLDAAARALLREYEGELDPSALARSTAFLNACAWQPVNDWRVSFELGSLAFRRGRHVVAVSLLGRALRDAPDEARFAITAMRFAALTWLAPVTAYRSTDMAPEAVREGYAALACALPDDDTLWIQDYLATEGDYSQLPDDLQTWPAHWRGSALAFVREEPDAIDAWLQALAEQYWPGAIPPLIRRLTAAGLTRTARYLADLVLEESRDDFRTLWESAHAVETIDENLLDTYLRQLEQRCRFDFRNTVRLCDLAGRQGRLDLYEELVLRASRQAEDATDLLATAELCRRTSWLTSRHLDEEGLRCLERALAVASDRLTRLEIARELFVYNRPDDARQVLDDERALAPDAGLEHVELHVLLQCAAFLSDEARDLLVGEGLRRLRADVDADALGPQSWAFVDRFLDHVRTLDVTLSDRDRDELATLARPSPTAWEGDVARSWDDVLTAIDYGAEDLVGAVTAELERTDSFGLRVKLIQQLRDDLGSRMHQARATRPDLPEDEQPVSRGQIAVTVRSTELNDLWRARLTASDPDAEQAAGGLLEDFFAREKGLVERWESARLADLRPRLGEIATVADALLQVLSAPLPPTRRDHPHPVLRTLFAAAAKDLEQLRNETVRVREWAGDALGGAPRTS